MGNYCNYIEPVEDDENEFKSYINTQKELENKKSNKNLNTPQSQPKKH